MALRLLTLLYLFGNAASLSAFESSRSHYAPLEVTDFHRSSSPCSAPDQEMTTEDSWAGSMPIGLPRDELVVGPDDRDPLEMMVDTEESCSEDDGETAAFCPEGLAIFGKGDLSPNLFGHLAFPPLLPAWRTPLRC